MKGMWTSIWRNSKSKASLTEDTHVACICTFHLWHLFLILTSWRWKAGLGHLCWQCLCECCLCSCGTGTDLNLEASLGLRVHQTQWEQTGKEKFLVSWSPLAPATSIYICYKNTCHLQHPVKIFFTYKIHIMEPAQIVKINFLGIGLINNIIAAVNEAKDNWLRLLLALNVWWKWFLHAPVSW